MLILTQSSARPRRRLHANERKEPLNPGPSQGGRSSRSALRADMHGRAWCVLHTDQGEGLTPRDARRKHVLGHASRLYAMTSRGTAGPRTTSRCPSTWPRSTPGTRRSGPGWATTRWSPSTRPNQRRPPGRREPWPCRPALTYEVNDAEGHASSDAFPALTVVAMRSRAARSSEASRSMK